jgi:hypothetical protein
MKKKLFIIAGALVVIGGAAAGALYYAYPVQISRIAGLTAITSFLGSLPQAQQLRN